MTTVAPAAIPLAVSLPAFFENLEAKLATESQVFEAYFAKLSPATVQSIKDAIKAGLSFEFPQLEAIRLEITNFLSQAIVFEQMIEQIVAIQTIPVTPTPVTAAQ